MISYRGRTNSYYLVRGHVRGRIRVICYLKTRLKLLSNDVNFERSIIHGQVKVMSVFLSWLARRTRNPWLVL
jgi:hypothetical protein